MEINQRLPDDAIVGVCFDTLYLANAGTERELLLDFCDKQLTVSYTLELHIQYITGRE